MTTTTDCTRFDGNAAARVDALLKRTCEFCQVTGIITVPVTTAGYMGSTTTDQCHTCKAAIVNAWPGLANEVRQSRDELAYLRAEIESVRNARDAALAEVERLRDRMSEAAAVLYLPEDEDETPAYTNPVDAALHGAADALLQSMKGNRHV